jgi:hypothetical protein
MGRQIIKQPNGLYAVWSTIIDNFVYINEDRGELIKSLTDEAINEIKEKTKEKVNKTIDELESGKKPYYQFTMTWKEAIKTIKNIHGKKEVNKLLKFYKKGNIQGE